MRSDGLNWGIGTGLFIVATLWLIGHAHGQNPGVTFDNNPVAGHAVTAVNPFTIHDAGAGPIISGGAAGGDLTGIYPNPTLAGIITAGGPTGSATQTPVITYDAKGRLTVVTVATIAPPFSALTGSATCAQLPALTGDITTSAGSCATSYTNTLPIGKLPFDSTTWRVATVNDTILTTDCGKTVELTTGYLTETLPASPFTGFPAGCEFSVKNGDAGRAKLWINAPTDIFSSRLWPLQVASFKIVNGVLVTTRNPGRWITPAAQTIHVDTVNGTDSTLVDGFTSGAGAFKSDLYAYTQVRNYWDCNGNYPCATETLDQNSNVLAVTQTITGPLFGGNETWANNQGLAAYVINGSGAGTCTVSTATNNVILYNLTGGVSVQFQNCTLTTTGGATGTFGFNVDNSYVAFTNATCGVFGASCFHVASGRIITTGTWNWTGAENILINAEDQGLADIGGTLTCSGSPSATTAIFQSDAGGGAVIDASSLTTSGCGAVTSKRVQAISNGTVFCAGVNIALGTGGITIGTGGYSDCGGGSYFPQPTFNSCGTGPVFITNSNDFGGRITVGTGAPASCVINWGLVHGIAPACVVSSNTATATQTVQSTTTTLTIGGSPASGSLLNYTCANLP